VADRVAPVGPAPVTTTRRNGRRARFRRRYPGGDPHRPSPGAGAVRALRTRRAVSVYHRAAEATPPVSSPAAAAVRRAPGTPPPRRGRA
jgi:hypothetical protein